LPASVVIIGGICDADEISETMTFTNPLALLLLLVAVPIVVYVGWPRRRYRRARDITSTAIRVVIVTLLVLSMAGAQAIQPANKLAVVFLVDVSDSVGVTAAEQAIEQVRGALAAMGAEDAAGVVLFGADAQVERAVSSVRELPSLRSLTSTGNTDIASAIRLGLAMFPSNAARRLVILSDGQQTLGDALAAAELSAASGVQISYVPITRQPVPEVRVTQFDAPSVVPQGQAFDLNLTVEADQDTPARISIYAGGQLVTVQETQLRAGTNRRTLTLEGSEAGFRDFSVVVEPPQDTDGFYQNNRLSTFSQVTGPARVLLVGAEDETRYLRDALSESGLVVDSVRANGLPSNAVQLAQYAAVLVANVPAADLNTRRMLALQAYVRDLGGGLVVIGGPQSFGPGGYFQTPLEETLPVNMQLQDQQRLPQLTIAYVIDRSGSMASADPNGVPLIEVAKSAINRSIDFLQQTDRAAIATFDAVAYWVAEFQDVLDRRALQQLVGTLRPSGGTDVLSGMQLVADAIVDEPSTLKHIILLTDGQTNPTGLVPLTEQLFRESNVTTTAIAIGAPSTLLENMANSGGGNYYVADDITKVPLIFAQETVLASRSYLFENPFTPALSAISPIMQGINALPELRGYVGTSAKASAQVILSAPEPFRDPVLAAWQYGLGRSVAFTGDATARWGANWVTWETFAQFWTQAVRWTITENSGNIETQVVMEGEQARVIVDARNAEGDFLNGLTLSASVVDPSLSGRRVELRQIAPGRYEGTFTPENEGAYLLRITGGVGTESTINQTNGWVMSYSPEYLASDGESILPALAVVTGGRDLSGDLAAAFTRDLDARAAALPLAPWLILIALILLPVDVAMRRLLITRSDLQRLRAALLGESATPQPADARISQLKDARERARQRSETPVTPIAPPPPTSPRGDAPRTPADAPPPPPVDTGENIGARLLKKKRDREG